VVVSLPKKVSELMEEIELLRLQLRARESEIEELRSELDDIHNSISYKIGRRIAETRLGARLKRVLRNRMK